MSWHTRKPALPPQLSKPSLRRFTWSRLHADLPSRNLWTLAARIAGLKRSMVEAFVARLDVHASTNEPRGYVGDFNIAALAAEWDDTEEAIARLYAALEDEKVGWLVQDHVLTFFERNPENEDPTAAERAARYRARKRTARTAGREAAREASASNNTSTSRRDGVTVTTRADQSTKLQGEIFELTELGHAEGKQPIRTRDEAEAWLAIEGTKIVCERCFLLTARVRVELARWQKQLGDNSIVLAKIIHAADTQSFSGGRFMDYVRDEIARASHERNGPALPLPPAAVKKSGQGS